MKELLEKLAELQQTLKVGKSQWNKFGNYGYRTTEDILEALKPHLGGFTLLMTEDMIFLGQDRYYKKVTAGLVSPDGEHQFKVDAFAREDDNQKGMTGAQLSGSIGSYAAKYALGRLFLLDDTKDDDATNTHGKTADKGVKAKEPKENKGQDKAPDVASETTNETTDKPAGRRSTSSFQRRRGAK